MRQENERFKAGRGGVGGMDAEVLPVDTQATRRIRAARLAPLRRSCRCP